jgi:hypothetical protein
MKAIKIKPIITASFFIFHFSFFTPLKAQIDTATHNKRICNSLMKRTYIFEGKVDSEKYFTIQTGQYTYVNFYAYLVEVTRVIKGDIHKGTIEVFQGAPGYTEKGPDGMIYTKSDDGPVPVIKEGVYFCWGTDKYMSKSCYANTNNKILNYNDGIAATNGIINKSNWYFSTLSDFYAYISANYGVKIEQ